MTSTTFVVLGAIASALVILFSYLSNHYKNKEDSISQSKLNEKIAEIAELQKEKGVLESKNSKLIEETLEIQTDQNLQLEKISKLQEEKGKLQEDIRLLLESELTPHVIVQPISFENGYLKVLINNIGDKTIRNINVSYSIRYRAHKDGQLVSDNEIKEFSISQFSDKNIFPKFGLKPNKTWETFWGIPEISDPNIPNNLDGIHFILKYVIGIDGYNSRELDPEGHFSRIFLSIDYKNPKNNKLKEVNNIPRLKKAR